jgi:exodeoxyribonuclease V alpha subunit
LILIDIENKHNEQNQYQAKQWFSNSSVFLQRLNNTGLKQGDIELPVTLQWLLLLKQQQIIQSMDYHFACFIYGELVGNLVARDDINKTLNLNENEVNFVLLLSAKLSFDMSMQDSCLNLEQLNIGLPFAWLPPELQNHQLTQQVLNLCPPQCEWQDILVRSGLVEVIKLPKTTENPTLEPQQEETPLVLFQHCLYMRRYFNYEKAVVDFITGVSSIAEVENKQSYWFEKLDQQKIQNTVIPLFSASDEIDWQKQAVINSIGKSFSVISGGPGTGKTTTVVKLLVALVQLHQKITHDSHNANKQNERPTELKIQLAAPTGKAAQRLAESIGNSLNGLDLPTSVKQLIPSNAVTIHRLLKPQGLNEFSYNANNKLFVDVLIIDEASMVDLSLMSKLLSAVPQHAQVILLGDKQQLSSVETGNVLAEICRAETESINTQGFTTGTVKLVVELQKSYRFNASGLIGQLATSINQGNSANVLKLLSGLESEQNLFAGEVNWIKPELDNYHLLIEHSFKHQLALIGKAKTFVDISTHEQEHELLAELFDHLLQFQILTCVKEGDFGIEGINRHIKNRLITRNFVEKHDHHYHCRPIMISENAYHLGLYNGDIGLQLTDGFTQQLMTYFIQADGTVMKVSCQRLPKHETVYAMTVHKSQGSEFSHVALVLPEPNQNNKILSKEILYTGLTRAKKQFTLFGHTNEIQQAINNATLRQSGLSLLLQQSLTK